MTHPLRIAVLFSRLSGYMAACLAALKERHGVELQVISTRPSPDAPFDPEQFAWIDRHHPRDAFDRESLHRQIADYDPAAILMSGWFDADYLDVARAYRQRGGVVIAGSDAQWTGSARQHLARLAAPFYLHNAIDVLWVAGERQRQFARRLGFTGARCWSGVYACDWPRFEGAYHARTEGKGGTERPSFLYVGRYVPVKGLDVLVDAYARYRSRVAEPWPLVCAGAGEQAGLLQGREGIEDRGFVQPEDLPALMQEASAFVLPSRREPWGVVVQEAAAAGLPLLCSDVCGAAVHLLQDGYNGYLFETGNAEHLAQCMARLTQAPVEAHRLMERRSHALSGQYTPQRWADTLAHGIAALNGTS